MNRRFPWSASSGASSMDASSPISPPCLPTLAITPTEKFYIRTCASSLLSDAGSWRIQLRGFGGFAGSSSSLAMDDLKELARPCGVHLMECSGNVEAGRFGLLSAAEWGGVPVSTLLERRGIGARMRVLVSGFDTYTSSSANSMPGASWIFSHE